jgi:hypothetical protein
VYGVGSTIGRTDRRRVPMLAIDAAYAPSDYNPHRWWYRVTRVIPGYSNKQRRAKYRDSLLVPFAKVDADLKQALRRWNIPDTAEVFFIPPPRTA